MPRRRTVKTGGAKRPAPSMPEGDEGKDMDHEKRKAKVETLIRDFRNEVDSRIRQLKAGTNELLNQIDLAYTMELMNIPQRIRQMPLSEFLKNGGSFEESSAGKVLGDELNSLLSANNNGPLESIDELPTENETRVVRPTRRRKEGAVLQGPPQTTRRGRSKAATSTTTPACNPLHSFATPLITPKFDPRLYQTPAVPMRIAKPGEVIVSMEGSPLMNPLTKDHKPGTIIIPMKNNMVVALDNSTDMSKIDFSQIDPNALAMFEKFQMMNSKLNAVKSFSSRS